jgi:hypothetical protein
MKRLIILYIVNWIKTFFFYLISLKKSFPSSCHMDIAHGISRGCYSFRNVRVTRDSLSHFGNRIASVIVTCCSSHISHWHTVCIEWKFGNVRVLYHDPNSPTLAHVCSYLPISFSPCLFLLYVCLSVLILAYRWIFHWFVFKIHTGYFRYVYPICHFLSYIFFFTFFCIMLVSLLSLYCSFSHHSFIVSPFLASYVYSSRKF